MQSIDAIKPIKIHVLPAGPNPWKPVLILEELGLPYSLNFISFEDVKKKPFTDINPNGRAPAIEDPNTDLTLWESGAIIQYIISQYDTNHILSYPSYALKETHLCNQWLAFQISGQGPYFGQAAWFNVLHPEKLPSAIARYNAELKRILSVLDGALEGRQWLVGDKMTFADLAFTVWNDRIEDLILCEKEKKFEGFPNVQAWHERMTSRPAWKKAMEKREKLMDEHGLLPNGMPKGFKSHGEFHASVEAKRKAEAAEVKE
ncbi:glutathione S-transferase [Lophiostoma macrostomum CBS 122681]|uniref:glutathione transferase n=1 Tax=Lophiostoma macrostomum CBS 122681 TaxID=1314788 RepID=A0A6A6TSC5_9PLEO|nr:glutathione S-transferase [Lophiostoma macrostomum CBS 122681]